MALLTCRDAAFAYEGSLVAEGLNFSVNRGDYLCIVGENGSGKSTLMKGLLGLKKPARGEITYGDGLQKNEVGYLPQQTPAQRDFPASVYEVVLSGRGSARGLMPFYTKQDRAIAAENMKRLGVLELEKRCYRELSGGQQQRVLLARALCATKTMLLLDEPAAGLDPKVTAELYRLVADINHSLGITIVMVSHDLHAAVAHASHILHLQNRQMYYGTAAGYRESGVGRVFLGGEADA